MDQFPVLLLIARPAAGKSEVINYLKKTPLTERINRFQIGNFTEIDDFPMLWTWFEEDALLEKMGHPRLHTDNEGYFLYEYLWDLLIERICLEYDKKRRDNPEGTIILEFSRGTQHGGFQRAFQHLSHEVLNDLSILYIDVSWEESLRKNQQRFNPERPDSVLEHGLPDEKLEKMYRHSDWEVMTQGNPELLSIQGHQIPYAVFDNSDDVTTAQGEALGLRLEAVLSTLWDQFKNNSLPKNNN